MESKVLEYLSKAKEVDELARKATDAEIRDTYQRMAQSWRDLAKQVE